MRKTVRWICVILCVAMLTGCAARGKNVVSTTDDIVTESPEVTELAVTTAPLTEEEKAPIREFDVSEVYAVSNEMKTASETDAVSETDVVSETDAVSETDVVSETDAVSETDVVSETDAVSETDVVSETDAVSETDVVSETDAVSETDVVSETDAVSEPNAVSENEAIALSESPAAASTVLTSKAPGIDVFENDVALIDYSNSKDGYIMAKYTGETDKRLKFRIKGPTTTYSYNLPVGKWQTFPLSDGNGSYKVTVYRNTSGSKYASVLSDSFSVKMDDEFAPFLRPNQYVNYEGAVKTIQKASQLVEGKSNTLDKVATIYDYVVETFSYDKEKAATVKSGYLPDLDEIMDLKKGICFDYAAVMAGMLRSQGIPCKMVIGYAGSAYHAWISVWTEEYGWIDGVIYFNGTTWHRMDPTYAASDADRDYLMDFIQDDSNYKAKYFY